MNQTNKYTIGKDVGSWRNESAQTLTFIVTEDCNLRCKYCYVTHKSSMARMSFETAKKFIDYIFTIKRPEQHAVILDFIGGEPFLEVELIDKICDYFKYKAFELDDEWYWNYRISVCTNGVNYHTEEVQRFIEKNYNKISVTITIDGTKEKHDLQRVFPNGEGSYDIVAKNIPLWLKQFPGNTKVTFSSDDLPLLKESIIHLWNMGIEEIAANVVFEDVWKEGDDKVFEEQLKELADYIIEHDLYDKYKCTLFSDSIGGGETRESLCQTSCGAGIMLALGVDGKIYPCQRYYPHSLNKKEGYVIGDIDNGIDNDKLRVFGTLMKKYQCDEECKNCPVASGCMFCQGFCYDEAETRTNFQRAKYICKMHKARVKANDYYFSKLRSVKGIEAERETFKNNLYFVCDNNYTSFCSYNNFGTYEHKQMNKERILEGLHFSREHFMKPIFLHSKDSDYSYVEEYGNYDIIHIVPIEFFETNKFSHNENYLLICEEDSIDRLKENVENIILNVKAENIKDLFNTIKKVFEFSDRINLNILDVDKSFDFEQYDNELLKCATFIVDRFNEKQEIKELNVLTDILWLQGHEGCGAGNNSLAYGEDGKLYICPAHYSQHGNSLGDLNEYHIGNQHLYSVEYFPICQECDAYHCEKCVYINEKYTSEVNVSPEFQCKKAYIERKNSILIQRGIGKEIQMKHILKDVDYVDPYQKMTHLKNGFTV